MADDRTLDELGAVFNPETSVPLDYQHHDHPDRHRFGEALGLPTSVRPVGFGTSAQVGSSDNPAREDHIHQFITDPNDPDFSTQPLLPPGGLLGYVLKKESNADYDTLWAPEGGNPSGTGYVPAGGDVDEVLTKLSSVDGDYTWLPVPGGGGGGIPELPAGGLSQHVLTRNLANVLTWQYPVWSKQAYMLGPVLANSESPPLRFVEHGMYYNRLRAWVDVAPVANLVVDFGTGGSNLVTVAAGQKTGAVDYATPKKLTGSDSTYWRVVTSDGTAVNLYVMIGFAQS